MKRIPLVLFAFLLLTNVSWGSCPSGQEENDRTGHCEPVQGARTFETLTEGYCYRYDERRNIYPQFVDLDYCDALGGGAICSSRLRSKGPIYERCFLY